MKSRPIILCIFLFVAVTETQGDCPPKEDLQDEYYTVIDLKSTAPRQPSDVRDAQAVLDSNKDEKVMASIFAYRDKIRRRRISRTIYNKNLLIADKLPTESEQALIDKTIYRDIRVGTIGTCFDGENYDMLLMQKEIKLGKASTYATDAKNRLKEELRKKENLIRKQ